MSRQPGYFNGRGQPRVIRKVIKKDAKGRPKIARDYKLAVTLERITARTAKPCTGVCIYPDNTIHPGTEFARLTRPEDSKRIGRRYLPDPKDMHFDCVPRRGMLLVRFLVPTPWRSTMCLDSSQVISHRRFTSDGAWLLWCEKHFPSMSRRFSTIHQVGTDYQWCSVEFKPQSFQKL